MALLIFLAVPCSTPANVERAASVVSRFFPPHGTKAFVARERIGREAQLGSSMVYRPGAIGGGGVDAALTYGEYDICLFASLVDRALCARSDGAAGATFVDVGSGCGRLVLAASVLWPSLARCAGVERVAQLHQLAIEAIGSADGVLGAPCSFYCGDAATYLGERGELAQADVLFAYSSTWPSEGELLSDFSATCGTHLRRGALVVTTDKKLASVPGLWNFRLVDKVEGFNRETGGNSVGFIWEVVQSARVDSSRRHPC